MPRATKAVQILLVLMVTALGNSAGEAAYRLMFQNGTSVEVQAYEDLGDTIRYPRLGGTVSIPKSSVVSIEEAVHLPAPSPPTSTVARPEYRSAPPVAIAPPPVSSVVPVSVVVPITRVGEAGIAPKMVWYFRVVSPVTGFIALVLYLNGTADNRVAQSLLREVRVARGRGERPLGVIMVGIYNAVFGVVAVYAGLATAFGIQIFDQLPMFIIPFEDQLALMGMSLAIAVFGVVILAAAYGVWTLQVWALPVQVAACFVEMICDAVSFFYSPPTAGSLYAVAGLIVASIILVYVSRPSIQAFYGHVPDRDAHPTPADESEPPSL